MPRDKACAGAASQGGVESDAAARYSSAVGRERSWPSEGFASPVMAAFRVIADVGYIDASSIRTAKFGASGWSKSFVARNNCGLFVTISATVRSGFNNINGL